MEAHERCPYCLGNGQHKPGCSAPANVKPVPPAHILTIRNDSPHTLWLRKTADPLVLDVVCIHTAHPDYVRGPVALATVDLTALNGEKE